MSKAITLLLCIVGIVGFLNLYFYYDKSSDMIYSTINFHHVNRLGKNPILDVQNWPENVQNWTTTNDRNSSDKFKELLEKTIEFSKSRAEGRKYMLKSITKASEYYNLFGSLAPEVFCPAKVRIGKLGDGGKWTCNPWKIPESCVIMSLGLNDQVDFEREVQAMLSNRCLIHGYDKDSQGMQTQEDYKKMRGETHIAKIGMDMPIEALASAQGIKSLEILKIDIEGSEHEVLIPFLEKVSSCQIYIEIHGDAPKHAALLQKIAHLNYRLFTYEVNGYNINAVEYSFIHESCIDKYGGYRMANYLDFNN